MSNSDLINASKNAYAPASNELKVHHVIIRMGISQNLHLITETMSEWDDDIKSIVIAAARDVVANKSKVSGISPVLSKYAVSFVMDEIYAHEITHCNFITRHSVEVVSGHSFEYVKGYLTYRAIDNNYEGIYRAVENLLKKLEKDIN